MNGKYDIGVVGCWYWGNYGSLLNGYATYSILSGLGLHVLNIVTPNNGFEPHAKKFFKAAYPADAISDVLSFDRLHEYNEICGAFLTGSDQIWNNASTLPYNKFFRLSFAEQGKKKISFATSFGNSVAPPNEETEKIYSDLLQKYSYISVREDVGVEICKRYYGVRATQLMEPVLDVDLGVWKKLAEKSDYAEEKGVLIVSACGNDGGSVYYPAAYPTVIGVGSHNETLEPSAFSCHGSGLDLLFSGEKVNAVSIKNADDYELVTGTSYSAALITSYAAAALEAYPELLPHQIRYFLRSSCEDICEKGYDEESGYGIFDPSLFFKHLSLFDKGEISCFSDVKKTDWYFDSVCYAEQNRLFLGVSDTEFAPNELLTRAMFITILYRADGRPQTNNMLKFDDVAEDAYYADAVCWASENGIITGVSDGKFAPDQNMTREEIAAVMSRYADYKGIHTASQGDLTVFADADAVSGWARESVAWAVDYGLLSGKENNLLDPRGDTTRAEAAAILKRFLEQ